MIEERRLTVFLDGWCVLCDGFGRVLLALDRGGRLRLLAQQSAGPAAARGAEAPEYAIAETRDGGRLRGEAAVRAILWQLPSPFRGLAVLVQMIPPSLQAAAYRVVARRRYRWFGRKTTCSVPSYPPGCSRRGYRSRSTRSDRRSPVPLVSR